jgi:hypothetical protein
VTKEKSEKKENEEESKQPADQDLAYQRLPF